MIRFSKFILESETEKEINTEVTYPKGVYIACKLSEVTEASIKEYQEKYLKGQDINEDLHCTLIYSQKPHVDEIEASEYKAVGTFNQFNLFGPDNNVLVLEIQSEDMIRRNEALVDEYGFISDYDEYKPHITLSYEFKGEINSLPIIDFEIILEKEYIDPLDTDWNGKSDDEESEESETFVGKEMSKSKSKEKEEK